MCVFFGVCVCVWLSTSFGCVVCFEMVYPSFHILADVLGRNSFTTGKADCLPSPVDWRIMLLVTEVRAQQCLCASVSLFVLLSVCCCCFVYVVFIFCSFLVICLPFYDYILDVADSVESKDLD